MSIIEALLSALFVVMFLVFFVLGMLVWFSDDDEKSLLKGFGLYGLSIVCLAVAFIFIMN